MDSTTGTALGSAPLTVVNGQAQATLTTTAVNAATDSITATYQSSNGLAGSTASTSLAAGSSNGNSSNGNSSNGNSTNQLWVQQVYHDLLGRAADSSGLNYWTSLLSGGDSRSQVAYLITQTTEYRTDQVMAAYQKLLGTTPDSSTLNYFVGLLANGTSIEGVDAIIVGSNTFFQTQGGDTTAGFLNAVYQDFLNRPLDSAGSAVWQQVLASGQTTTQVAMDILSTSEYFTDVVQNIYQTYLGRAADQTSLSAFVASLQGGGGSDNTVLAAVLGSPEFLSHATSATPPATPTANTTVNTTANTTAIPPTTPPATPPATPTANSTAIPPATPTAIPPTTPTANTTA
jgi:hypothetical protein